MVSQEITIANEEGLHARPAALFVKAASKFTSDITLEANGKKANAKSVMRLMTVGAKKGMSVKISAEGSDEQEAVQSLIELIQSGFGE